MTTTEVPRTLFDDAYKQLYERKQYLTTAEAIPETTMTTTSDDTQSSTTESSQSPEISFGNPTTVAPAYQDLLPPCSDYCKFLFSSFFLFQ